MNVVIDMSKEYYVDYRGERITGGFETKKEAQEWIRDFKRVAKVMVEGD